MKKQLLSILIILTAVLIPLTACKSPENTSPTTKPAKQDALIYIDGELLSNEVTATITTDFVEIPFFSVFEFLGGTVTWQSETQVQLEYNNEIYKYDAKEKQIYQNLGEYTINYLCPVAGGTSCIRPEGKDLILDIDTVTLLLESLAEINADIKVDRDNFIVNITSK